jgi:hypothetical protein
MEVQVVRFGQSFPGVIRRDDLSPLDGVRMSVNIDDQGVQLLLTPDEAQRIAAALEDAAIEARESGTRNGFRRFLCLLGVK